MTKITQHRCVVGTLVTPVQLKSSNGFRTTIQGRRTTAVMYCFKYLSFDSSSLQFTPPSSSPPPQSIFSHCLSCTQPSRGPGDFPNYFEGEGGVTPWTKYQHIAGQTQADKQLSALAHNSQFRVANPLNSHAFEQKREATQTQGGLANPTHKDPELNR